MVRRTKLLLAILCAFALCFALAACGGSNSAPASSASGSQSASESASESSSVPEDPADKFVGDWKIAAIETQGITVVGNFAQAFESAADMSLSMKADGTGALSLGEESKAFTWELADDNNATVKMEDEEESVTIAYADDVLSLAMNTEDISGTMFFTQDGTYAAAKTISLADGADVASEADVLGAWNLAGAGMSGMTMYGDEKSLQAIGVGSDSMTLVLEEGGSASALGDDALWEFADGAASVTVSYAGQTLQLPLKTVDDYLLLDVTNLMGSDMFFLFQK